MNVVIKGVLTSLGRLFGRRQNRRYLYLLLLGGLALAELHSLRLVRRTFVFYSIADGRPVVEDRMFPRADSWEIDITRYVEETLLGPVSPDLAPLFPRETPLRSLLYRDGVVYADLGESAAFTFLEGGDIFRNLKTLEAGLRRNFAFIKETRFFIAGNQVSDIE
jgi:hypothetical protein